NRVHDPAIRGSWFYSETIEIVDMDVEYFRDDVETLIACLGTWGAVAMFRLRQGDQEWEFLVPGSPTWDEVHQGIYRNMHEYRQVDPAALPSNLPLFPEIPKGPFPKREDYVLPATPILASSYPALTTFLRRRNGTITVVVMLLEDRYETSFGDGEFL